MMAITAMMPPPRAGGCSYDAKRSACVLLGLDRLMRDRSLALECVQQKFGSELGELQPPLRPFTRNGALEIVLEFGPQFITPAVNDVAHRLGEVCDLQLDPAERHRSAMAGAPVRCGSVSHRRLAI